MELELDVYISDNNGEVSYNGEVLFSFKYYTEWIPYRPATLEDPEEGGYEELLNIDNIPEHYKWLEEDLYEIIDEKINE